MFKALFKDTPPIIQFVMLVVVICFFAILLSVFTVILIAVKVGTSLNVILETQQNLVNYPDLLRGILFFQDLLLFIFPAIVCAWLFSKNYKDYLHIDNPFYLPTAGWAFLSIVVSVPFVNLTYYLNQQMVLPEALKGLETWMKTNEEINSQVLESAFLSDNLGALIISIGIACVLAGIGEEFMFRGLLQNMFGRFMRNQHAVIWTVAILFSAIHLQFYGFLPRLLLGAWLGYLLYYTKSIWIPVLAHFTNNLIGIITMYVFRDSPKELEVANTIGTGSTWWLAVASLALFVFCWSKVKIIRN
ncbi:MAG: CPBP family intramembrane metalloprotease [Dysgonamonadaceae bacterium]|jgi:membrane protease YdiL (CAAX protease family)|nr:CPBP family intramembrane metalloprotease [Dysgonamonadaceae bacterium]